MLEKNLVKRILKGVNKNPRAKAIKQHGNVYAESGTPDIVGCFRGQMFLIEAKVKGRDLSAIQMQRLREWENSGALVFVAREGFSVDEFFQEMLFGKEK